MRTASTSHCFPITSEEECVLPHLQKLGCMTFLHPKVECHIVPDDLICKQQPSHHFGDRQNANHRQKFGCMISGPSMEECCTAHRYSHHRQQHCHHLGVFNSIYQRRNVALPKFIISKRHSKAVTSEKNCMFTARRSLRVCQSIIQCWNYALSFTICSASHNLAITSEKHSMKIACSNH